MSDLAIFTIAVLAGIACFFALRASHWKRRYNTLLDDAFERGCRAVVTEESIVNRAAIGRVPHGPQIGYKQFPKKP
jgi:hypothetical protein